MADGLQIQCKVCRSEYQKKYRETKEGKDRDARWNASNGARDCYVKYKNANKLKKSAHQVIKNEIRSGRMIKECCSECGSQKAVSHHDDYNYPLVVRWLCAKCHSKWHKINGPGLNG